MARSSAARAADAKPRVLVVDDDPVVRMLAAEALTTIGFAAEEAPDGASALVALEAGAPDLIVLDVHMAGIDGIETCAAIRARPGGADVPILVATGLTDGETIDRAFRAGATDFIKKPFEWQILQHRVRFLMRANSAFSDLRRTLSDLRESRELLADAQRRARLGSWEWEPGTTEMLWSEELYRIFGVERHAGASSYEAFMSVIHAEDRETVEKALRRAVCEVTDFAFDHRIVTAAGLERMVHHQGEAIPGPSNATFRISGTIQDITERKLAEERIHFLAHYDELTALPNRRLLCEHLSRVLARAARRRESVALLCLDLDRFKRFNETLGHELGDQLLRAMANRLAACVRAGDLIGRHANEPGDVSRLGGDEFSVVLHGIRGSGDAAHASRRILDTLSAPLSLAGQEIVVGASVGIAVFPSDGGDAETLLRSAAAAMYEAKTQGRGAYRFFNASMNDRAIRNLRLENGLRRALDRGDLQLRYQPQWHPETRAVLGLEALARWESLEYGSVNPAEFVPLAEETGLIEPLGTWVLRSACVEAARWQAAGLPNVRIAVNVSSHQVRRAGLVETVAGALRDSGLDPKRLELEITESALIGDDATVERTLAAVKALGVRLALDDFGTGYSSLSHLVRFPIDVIKVDQSFVRRLDTDPQAAGLVGAVIAMARRLSLVVVAEGVETELQERFLREQQCDALQGFRLGRPLRSAEVEALLRTQGG